MHVPALLLLAAVTGAGADPAVAARVDALLNAIDRPVRAETWRALGPDGEAVLADVARSRDFPARRARALEGLVAFGTARATEIHRALAAEGAAPRAVRRSAVRGLARLVEPRAARAELGRFLEGDRDPAVRAAAAEALAAAVPADGGCDAVRAQARREAGRTIYTRALEVCARSRAR